MTIQNSFLATWIIEDDGRPIETIVQSLIAKRYYIHDLALEILRKSEAVPARGTKYHLVGLKGADFPANVRLGNRFIFEWAVQSPRNFGKPPIRAGLLLREKFTQAALGCGKVAVMHEPILSASDSFRILGLSLDPQNQTEGLFGWSGRPQRRWTEQENYLFVFLLR